MSSLSDMLCRIEVKEKHSLPNLHEGHTLLVVSDYSGQHATANYESLSFLIAICRGRTPSDAKKPVRREKRRNTEVAAAYRIAIAETPTIHVTTPLPNTRAATCRNIGPSSQPDNRNAHASHATP